MCDSLFHMVHLHKGSSITEEGPPPHLLQARITREQGTILDTREMQFAGNSPYSQGSNTNKYKRTVKKALH